MKLGASRVALEWPPGLPMAGYARRTLPAAGYHRPLYVRALVASDDDDKHICLLSAETLCVDAALTARIRQQISTSTSITPDAILVAATHTHAAPGGIAQFPIMAGAESFLNPYVPERVEYFVERCVQAVHRAVEAQSPVQLQFGIGLTQGIAANRREANGVHDPSLPFVIAHDTSGRVQAVIFSFACHPTILGADNQRYSGDLIGTASALIESRWNTVALGLTGAAGNISTRFTRRESSVAEVERMAQQLADGILAADAQSFQSKQLDYAQARLDLVLKPARGKAIVREELSLAQAQIESVTNPAERRIVETATEGLQLELAAQERPAHLTTEVQILRLGDVCVIGFPGEMFVEYGLELAEALAPAPVLIAGYANDYIGYVPTPDALRGYEADTAVVQPTAGRDLLRQTRKMVSMWIRKSAEDRSI